MNKECKKCNLEKEINEFRVFKTGRLCSWCKDCEKEYKKVYGKKYRKEHQKELQEKAKIYWSEHREQQRILKRKSRAKNKEKEFEYQRKRRKEDNIYKLKCQLRHLIGMSFYRNGYVKKDKLENIVGCSYDELVKHLIETYKKNYNEEYNCNINVHIDHIIPLSTATNEEDIIKLCHYTNLQLLKAKDNLEKSDKLDWSLLNE